MSGVTQKCEYALRAVLQLALCRQDQRVGVVAEIAAAQAIPSRFLQLILNELRQAGFVESRRGKLGGYTLAIDPTELKVGEIIRLIDGPWAPAERATDTGNRSPFNRLWSRAGAALTKVYDGTTIQDLVDDYQIANGRTDYCI
jgi:Rrf2 family protein